MRKIEKRIMPAFLARQACAVGNTSTDGESIQLHGNTIIKREADGSIHATLAGWPTATTRSRINALSAMLPGSCGVHQADGKQLLDDGREVSAYQWFKLTD